MTGQLDHVMMRVEDLEAAEDFYKGHFGYEEVGRWDADTFTNVHLAPPDASDDAATLELTYNHDGRSYTMGDAWGHIAVRVEDVYEAYDELMEAGVEDYRDPDSCGGSYAFVKDPDGHEIEIVERDHGARWSLDHTMIRVEDANEAIGWYQRAMDYDLVRRAEMDSFALYFMAPSDAPAEAMTVELTYNYDGRSYELGDAWGHLAARVDDLEADWDTLMLRDAEDYRDPESCDFNYAFTKDSDGHEIELVER
ncbi:lactoylglutathione lyase/Glyoxalase/bleomycin resistance protein/dioxygenase [Salinarchaeum sp. Harcht-Bsk1]|uniref:VOC family protein n=1 Tax=Salinarchaeum sp. Harcht-Bsk1 TaxID=1333523 RepID=UPI0003423822|nr:VOC family protein [Salinarchaeum sp. Harcht-Bsk1]AGN02687.1 lactoylglutathione lyase/Glyoxalase/bleomycin resistance protein/dioxygenase [Salinarchaeum sp. Harcht-Bsk1]